MWSSCNLTIGLPGGGKGIDASVKAQACLARSLSIQKNWKKMGFESQPPIRQIGFNYHINPKVVAKYPEYVFTWHDPLEMVFLDYPMNTRIRKNFDCYWDEISIEVANGTMREDKIHPELLRFFGQHRHRGVQIFANTQDYKMVDINFRRMVSRVDVVSKVIGSGDPDPTLPPIKRIWGIILKKEVEKKSIENDDKDIDTSWIPNFYWIGKDKCEFYDTMCDVNTKVEFDLKHRTRKCGICGFEKTYHT